MALKGPEVGCSGSIRGALEFFVTCRFRFSLSAIALLLWTCWTLGLSIDWRAG